MIYYYATTSVTSAFKNYKSHDALGPLRLALLFGKKAAKLDCGIKPTAGGDKATKINHISVNKWVEILSI